MVNAALWVVIVAWRDDRSYPQKHRYLKNDCSNSCMKARNKFNPNKHVLQKQKGTIETSFVQLYISIL